VSPGVRTLVLVSGLFVIGPLLIVAVRLVGGRRPEARSSIEKVPLWKRYLTLLALTGVYLGAAWLGELPFLLVMLFLAGVGAYELHTALVPEPVAGDRAIVTVAVLSVVAAAHFHGPSTVAVTSTIGLLATLGAAALPRRRARLEARSGAAALTLLFVGVLFALVVALRRGESGFGRVVFLYAAMQLNDVFSMLGGLAFGRRKLAPVLSPGKTWAGAISGCLAASLGSLLFAYCLPGFVGWRIAALSGALAMSGLVGGLIASAIKRATGVKDFGTIFPGHGGVLDRFDSLLVSAPVLWLVLTVSGT
jgi:phosphatidate cytidylyltransferase